MRLQEAKMCERKQRVSVACAAHATDRPPREKAHAWLRAIAEEEEEVKNMILQELMGDEDFQST